MIENINCTEVCFSRGMLDSQIKVCALSPKKVREKDWNTESLINHHICLNHSEENTFSSKHINEIKTY